MFDRMFIVFAEPYGRRVLGIFADYDSAYDMFLAASRGVEDAKYEEYVMKAPCFMNWSSVVRLASRGDGDE